MDLSSVTGMVPGAENAVNAVHPAQATSTGGGTTTNGTAARLCTLHKDPVTDPTPGANYGSHTPDELSKALNDQSAYACQQWQAGGGVVGPTGSEGNWFFGTFNDPTNSNYERNQAFGYQHDLQATDAELQKTKETESKYTNANRSSATQGMIVLKTTGDVNKAMAKTQEVWKSYGFTVRQTY